MCVCVLAQNLAALLLLKSSHLRRVVNLVAARATSRRVQIHHATPRHSRFIHSFSFTKTKNVSNNNVSRTYAYVRACVFASVATTTTTTLKVTTRSISSCYAGSVDAVRIGSKRATPQVAAKRVKNIKKKITTTVNQEIKAKCHAKAVVTSPCHRSLSQRLFVASSTARVRTSENSVKQASTTPHTRIHTYMCTNIQSAGNMLLLLGCCFFAVVVFGFFVWFFILGQYTNSWRCVRVCGCPAFSSVHAGIVVTSRFVYIFAWPVQRVAVVVIHDLTSISWLA